MWKLVPVKTDAAFASSQLPSEPLGSGPLPPYNEGTTGQSSTRAHRMESEHDEFGTIVHEVTVVTSTITTRKKYRVEDS